MNAPAPAPELRALTKALAGRWTTREKYEPTGPTPHRGIGQGDLVWRSGPGEFTLLEEYHSKTPMGELFGFGLIWWDHVRGLQHMWCINVNPGGCEMFPPPPRPGPKWDGKQLVLDTEVDIAGTKYVWHEAISVTSATFFTQTVDIGETSGAMKRWLTSDATKVTSQAHATPDTTITPANEFSDEERIRNIEQQWPKALARHDAVWLGQHTADQLIQVDPDGSVLNKSAYISKRVNNDERTLSAVNNTDGVYIHGDIAVAHGNSHFTVLRQGKKYFLSLRWTSTYVKQNGTWRVIAGQLTPINGNWRTPFLTSK